jgi:hypothetical protein
MKRDVYMPLLSDNEISQINAEREERRGAAMALQEQWRDEWDMGGGNIAGFSPADSEPPSESMYRLSEFVIALILVGTIAAVLLGML